MRYDARISLKKQDLDVLCSVSSLLLLWSLGLSLDGVMRAASFASVSG